MPGAPTSDARHSWFNVLLLLGASVLFATAVLPRLEPAAAKLRGTDAPDFTLPVVYGGLPDSRVHLSDLRGKAVVLDFWASWCGVCQSQAPILDRVARQLQAENVVVIGVNTGDRPDQAVAFARSRSLSYASVLDDGSVAAQATGRYLRQPIERITQSDFARDWLPDDRPRPEEVEV